MSRHELNPCSDGLPFDASPVPARHLKNPCDHNGTQPGVTFTIPAQQFNALTFATTNGSAVLFFGERWGSGRTIDENFVYIAPFHFDAAGGVLPLQWEDSFSLNVLD